VSYRWVDHTAEVELHVEAASQQEVLEDAMKAVAELLDGGSGLRESRHVRVDAPDRGALLVQWLEELVFLAETDGFIPEEAEITLGDGLEATVQGRLGEPRPLVKAVTYHGLEFEPAGDGWRAKVVLDV
jgi:SHS2 domain-containing protein